MNEVDKAKTIAMVILFAVSLVLGLIPIWIARRMKWKSGNNEMSSKTKNILSGMLCFGAGVLMATSLTHLLPELHDGVGGLQEDGKLPSKLPLAEIFFSAGFFLVYLVEEVVHLISDQHAHNKTDVSIHRSVGVRECSISREGQPVPPCLPEEDMDCHENTLCQSNCNERDFCKEIEPSIVTISGSDQSIVKRVSVASNGSGKSSVHHHHHHHAMGDGDRVLPSVRGLLVIVGLSLHEILEGVAIGLETTEGNVWSLFAAVSSHKFVIAFCVGMEMATNGVKTSLHVCYMLVLSLVTSIGKKINPISNPTWFYNQSCNSSCRDWNWNGPVLGHFGQFSVDVTGPTGPCCWHAHLRSFLRSFGAWTIQIVN